MMTYVAFIRHLKRPNRKWSLSVNLVKLYTSAEGITERVLLILSENDVLVASPQHLH